MKDIIDNLEKITKTKTPYPPTGALIKILSLAIMDISKNGL